MNRWRGVVAHPQLNALLWVATLLAINQPAVGSQLGREYWLGWPPTYYDSAELILYNPGGNDVSVSMNSRLGTSNLTIPAGASSRVALDPALRASASTGVAAGALGVTAAAEIAIVFQSPATVGVADTLAFTAHDATAIAPACALGSDYRVLAAPNTSSASASFAMVIAGTVTTQVEVTDGCANGSWTLEPGESLTLVCDGVGADLTGTHIVSSAPIAVLAGNRLATVPTSGTSGDLLLEMLPPTAAWGTTFVAAPFTRHAALPESGDVIRILAADAGMITIEDELGPRAQAIARGAHIDVDTAGPSSGQALAITADVPILVASFAKSRNLTGVGDPSMTMLQAQTHWRTQHIVLSPDGYDQGHYVGVVAALGRLIEVDGSSLPMTPIGNTLYAHGTRALVSPPTGGTSVSIVTADGPIGVVAYGYGNFKSFAYTTGFAAATAQPPVVGNRLRVTRNGDDLRLTWATAAGLWRLQRDDDRPFDSPATLVETSATAINLTDEMSLSVPLHLYRVDAVTCGD